ncbi:MAG: GDP-mannose dehydrogenase, partial [Pseudomonadota bacterium]
AALATDLPDMLRDCPKAVVSEADAVIVTHANDLYREAVSGAGDTPVIDVCRLFKAAPQRTDIRGIGW